MTLSQICNKIIEYSFYAIFFLVPLALSSETFELFEFNKMWVTYFLTIVIASTWIVKSVIQKKFYIQKTPLDIPIILFLVSQIISTIFSLDSYISFWGYYSRFNGGLLSIFAYVILYYSFVSNFINTQDSQKNNQKSDSLTPGKRMLIFGSGLITFVLGIGLSTLSPEMEPYAPLIITTTIASLFLFIWALPGNMVLKSLYISLTSGGIVALWGLPSHFGYDPTCLIFRGSFDVSCWTHDFQPMVRIFSTLGQPDWLAAYLSILIPISIALFIHYSQNKTKNHTDNKNSESFLVKNKNLLLTALFFMLSLLFYLDLLYTGARAGFVAISFSLIIFFLLFILINRGKIITIFPGKLIKNFWHIFIVLLSILIITFFIGQPFPRFEIFTLEGILKSMPKTTEVSPSEPSPEPERRFATEFGGTDSGQIRLYVWNGAIDAWLHYPVFGTGVETFAFAYYMFRPEGHNLTSEWNFLYNKAHNEYLNYLTTTGIVGLGTYLSIIGLFLFLAIKKILWRNIKDTDTSHDHHKISKNKEEMLLQAQSESKMIRILSIGLLTGFTTILITNFFGFSVVITNIYLFLIPAFFFILNGNIRIPKQSFNTNHVSPWGWTFIAATITVALYMIFTLFMYWLADKDYALGSNLNKAREFQAAYPRLLEAANKRGGEPVYKDELAVNSAMLAAGFLNQAAQNEDSDAPQDETLTVARNLIQNAINLNNQITTAHPNNILFWKSRVRIFYTLAQVDPTFFPQALEAVKKAAELAPNDANIIYNLGVLYGQNGNTQNGIKALERTIDLKPDYRDAYYALALFYHDEATDDEGNVIDREKLDKAIEKVQFIIDHISDDDQIAIDALEEWKKL